MAAEPATSAPPARTNQMETSLPLHRIDVDTYYRIAETGILDDLRVELLEGLIIDMSPPSPEHSAIIARLTQHLASASRGHVRVQLPLEVPPRNVPQPDLALIAGPISTKHHPHTALLAIEVAVSSHMTDRNLKARYYARAEIPTYWIVDVPGRAVEVRTVPGADGYGKCEIYHDGDIVPSPVAGLDELDVSALLAD
jgi:Uma2 family endonuclease